MKKYPICPECGCNTLALFAPVREDVWNDIEKRYALIGTNEYVDWDMAYIYCTNASANCRVEMPIKSLTTPIMEPRYCLKETRIRRAKRWLYGTYQLLKQPV